MKLIDLLNHLGTNAGHLSYDVDVLIEVKGHQYRLPLTDVAYSHREKKVIFMHENDEALFSQDHEDAQGGQG